METPFTDHITQDDFKHVYEPAEDTFLLLDALEKDISFIESKNPTICLEIGSGSGLIITALSKKLKSSYCIATDISPFACKTTQKTALYNNGQVDVTNMKFTNFFRSKIIDILFFNPPYVPTMQSEFNHSENSTSEHLIRTWSGGSNGREIIDELIPMLPKILTPGGVFYLLVLKQNQPQDIIRCIQQLGLKANIFMERKIPGEHLYIIKTINE